MRRCVALGAVVLVIFSIVVLCVSGADSRCIAHDVFKKGLINI